MKIWIFVKLCDSVIIEIRRINFIYDKEFYAPLENALLSFNIEPMLNLIHPPLIESSQSNFKINYVPSTFPHYFYNYSDYTIQFNSKNSIQIIPFNNNIQNDQFSWSSRFLNVGNNKILLTGGCNPPICSTFLFDLVNKTIENYPNLIKERRWHSMAWINNYPAVIGGDDGENGMISVEILKNWAWIEGPSINTPRSHHTSITCHKSAWIIGGINQIVLDSIEKYEKYQWKLIKVSLHIPSSLVCIMCIENSLLLLGGKNENNKIIDNILFMNTINLEIKEISKLKSPGRFPHTHIFIDSTQNMILGRSDNDKVICFEIDLKMIFH